MIVAVAAAAMLILGIAVIVILLVVVAIRREDRWRAGRLPENAPEGIARLARRMSGLHIMRSDPYYRVTVRPGAVLGGDEEDPEPKTIAF